MKILICVKQVPDSECPIQIDGKFGWIRTHEIFEFRMNRLDEFAVEEAVMIKEAFPETRIDAVTVGPDRSAEVLKRSIGMGANNGIHIKTEGDEYLTSFEVAAAIAEYARNKHYDLIFTGALSEDNMQGQVGPMIAALLAIPWATAVVYERIAADKKTIQAEQEIENGVRQIFELRLPAVLTIQSGINTPRYPTLSNLLRANQLELETILAAELALPSPAETIVQLAYPKKTREGKVLEGTSQEKASRLVAILHEKTLL
jgi:electron transfer flavoprotein beta subunit